ncbi:hypothetical protein AB0C76_32910 [Kitasatospora sp. NPDC048722]|uniref:hypothetical protein n=1 Tax=Kitasatospora sp. NPDC048722 TaxID=3155639 RepID=UPI0033C5C486
MTLRRIHAAALAAAAAAVLTVAGCGSDGAKTKKADDPSAAVLKAAREYQEAANKGDWPKACTLMTARLRGGSVADCENDHAANPVTVEHWSPSPTASPTPTLPPPVYADGSTPPPIATATPTGPDFADTGKVDLSNVTAVPAAGNHPAGWAVYATWSVTWPDKPVDTDRRALRLVQEDGAWKVDQHEDAINSPAELTAILGKVTP